MCGVLAYARATADEPPVREDRWARAMARLAPRGPDGPAQWRSPTDIIRLGHTRLAINDLSPAGAQPMVLERPGGALALVANAEIYNAPSLRRDLERDGSIFRGRSDCEVLLHAVDRWGFDRAIDAARGMFAVIVWDERQHRLLAAVDHAGMKPLVWARAGAGIVLASDADAVIAMLGRRPELRGDGLAHVLGLGYCPAPGTVWQGLSKLGPGERLEWHARGPGATAAARVSRWWAPPQSIDDRPSPDPRGQCEEFEQIWSRVAQEHLLSDVPVGVFLSGGLDSSAVAAGVAGGMAVERGIPVRAFTLGLDSHQDESTSAAQTAAHLGLEHIVVPLGVEAVPDALEMYARAYDEPQTFGALLTFVMLARAAARHGRVMLSGDGGDEAFGGYSWHGPEYADTAPPVGRLEQADAHPRRGGPGGGAPGASQPSRTTPASRGALSVLGSDPAAQVSRGLAGAQFRRVMPWFEVGEVQRLLEPLGVLYDERTRACWADPFDLRGLPWPRRAQSLDLMTFCAGSILPKLDRGSMAVGLEVRSPFLDRRLLEWALRLPARDAGRPLTEGGTPARPPARTPATAKLVLREYLRGRVPDGVLTRPKQGFSLRTKPGLWDTAVERLGESRLVRDGLLHEHWRAMVAPDQPHAAGKRQALTMLAAWWEARA